MKVLETLIVLVVLLSSYGEIVQNNDGLKGIDAGNKKVVIRTADCSKVRNITYVRNDEIQQCKIDQEPIKFFPRNVQIIGKGFMCIIVSSYVELDLRKRPNKMNK